MSPDPLTLIFPALKHLLADHSPVSMRYGIAMFAVELGLAALISVVPADPPEFGATAVFKTSEGRVFTAFKPRLSAAEEDEMLQVIRRRLEEWEGYL